MISLGLSPDTGSRYRNSCDRSLFSVPVSDRGMRSFIYIIGSDDIAKTVISVVVNKL